MIRPAFETILAALLIALGAFIYLFGVPGLALVGLSMPAVEIPQHWVDAAAIAVAAVGAYFASGLWGGHPEWRRAFMALTVLLLAGEWWLLAVTYGGAMLR